MGSAWRSTIILSLVFLLVGCQFMSNRDKPSQTPDSNAIVTHAEKEAYPYPVAEITPNEYPEPQAELEVAGMYYPDLKDGDSIDWFPAFGLLASGQVVKVMQTHDLKVYLTLKDGRTLVTVEPAIDEIIRSIEHCGEPCKQILIATE